MITLRKLLVAALFLLGVIVIIASCNINTKINTVPTAKSTVIHSTKTFATKQLNIIGHWLNQGAREELIRNATRSFEFRNQEILVNLTFPEDVYMNKLNSGSEEQFIAQTIKSNNPKWDIIRIGGSRTYIGELVNDPNWMKNNLVDFSQIPEFRATTRSEILSEDYKSEWGGIVPGPAIEGQYWCLFYNKNLADKVGITVKDKNMTFEDFKSYINAINRYNQQNPHDYIVPISEATDWGTSGIIPLQLYASLFNNKEEFADGIYTEEKLQNWFKVLNELEELSNLNAFDKNKEQIAWNDMSREMLNDRYMFFINGSWMYNIWKEADETKVLNIHPVELPALKSTNLYPLGYNVIWAVPKNAPNKQEAIDFLLYLNSSDIAQQWVKNTKSPTGIKGRMTDINFGEDQYEKFSRHLNSAYGSGNYNTRPNNSYMFGYRFEKVKSYDMEVLNGEITAEQAIANIKSAIASHNQISYNE